MAGAAGRPDHAGGRLRPPGGGDDHDRAFLLESVEHAERWGRWSFVGRRPSATLIARDGRISVEGELPAGVPLDRGVLAAVEALLRAYRSPVIEELPPLHGGIVGYLGYDVVREVEHLPGAPPDEAGYPDAILSVVGQLAAYDYWRQRVTLIDSVPIPPAAAGEPGGLRRPLRRRPGPPRRPGRRGGPSARRAAAGAART